MSWCLPAASALNVSADLSQRSEPCTFFAPHSAWFSTSVTSPAPVEGFFGSLLVSMNVSDIFVLHYSRDKSGLHPDFAVLALPAQIVGGAFEDGGLETVGRLPL